MDSHPTSLRSLDWPPLLAALAAEADSEGGARHLAALPLAPDRSTAETWIREVEQLRAWITEGHTPPRIPVTDVEPILAAACRGQVLDAPAVRQIITLVSLVESVLAFFAIHTGYGPLDGIAALFTSLPNLEDDIGSVFASDGTLRDDASPDLRAFRRERDRLRHAIEAQLHDLMGQADIGRLLQDRFITQRSDRFVLPFKATGDAMKAGIVHDTSRSGETIFVEPTAIVDLNNRLKIAESKVQHEEERILRALSETIATSAPDLRSNQAALIAFDILAAKARFADKLGAHAPIVTTARSIRLRNLAHPLLLLHPTNVVIRNSVTLDDNGRAIVITGPNAGGKTVILKGVGLAALMARAGLPICAGSDSEIGFFDCVLADIGDQQSIQGDLSTFSGHMRNVADILRIASATEAPLVLLDELCVGTNPEQGVALATAILRHLVERTPSMVLTTTHYDALKALAELDPRFINAGMQFDSTTLRPTFVLALGTPGRSYAFDIARRYGMPDEVMDRAGSVTDDLTLALDKIAQRLRAKESEIDTILAEINTRERALAKTERHLKAQEEALRDREEERASSQSARFDQIFLQAKRRLRELTAAAQRGEMHSIASARAELQRLETEVAGERASADALEKTGTQGPPIEMSPLAASTLRGGDQVFVRSINKTGVVREVRPDGRVDLSVGQFTFTVSAGDLRAIENPASEPQPRSKPRGKSTPRVQTAPESANAGADGDAIEATRSNSCDLRGLRADEVIDRVEQFLDDAALNHRDIVFLIHGHGTEALKKTVRAYVQKSPYVARWAPGAREQGGDGVTRVHLS